MAEELELKAVVPDAAALRARLVAAGALPGFAGRMRDLRLDRAGELSAGDQVLRVRVFENGSGSGWILGWKGPTRRSPEGYKLREERECRGQGNEADALAVLGALGYRPVGRIDRAVEYFTLADAAVRIEHYPAMDDLVEVEGTPDAIERAAQATGLPRESFSAEPLAAFVARYEARVARPARLASEGDLSP